MVQMKLSARNYAKRRVLQKVNQLKDNRTGAFIADQLTVRELVAEHGVDFSLMTNADIETFVRGGLVH